MHAEAGFFERVYRLVAEVPLGRVATYGQIAALLGVPHGARAVGWALRALPEARAGGVPWHRVVGAGGRISPRAAGGHTLQRRRLRAEGVRFRAGRVDLERHGLLSSGATEPARPGFGGGVSKCAPFRLTEDRTSISRGAPDEDAAGLRSCRSECSNRGGGTRRDVAKPSRPGSAAGAPRRGRS
jgi:methylated-DNA-protein-cysteine methyltransferase-like protein